MEKREFGTVIFHKDTGLYTVKTPRGEFHDVRSLSGFDSLDDMEHSVYSHFGEERMKKGVLGWILDSSDKEYIFLYPRSWDYIVVYLEDSKESPD